MFLDLRDHVPPPPWQPPPPEPRLRLTAGQEKALAAIIAVNILLLIVSPIGGATLIEVLVALFR